MSYLEDLEGQLIDLQAQMAHLHKMLSMAGERDAMPPANFERAVAEIRRRDNCSETEALRKARKEMPDSFAAYQSPTVA